MFSSKVIGGNIQSQISAWILMVMVLMTIIPFNLFHTHNEEKVVIQVNQIQDHGSCQHQFHIAEEQELCLLCHFVFVPSYELSCNLNLEAVQSRLVKLQSVKNHRQYHFLSVYSILNKGSPLV